MGKSDYTFRYKVRNWPEYNRALVKRGQLTLWFDTNTLPIFFGTTHDRLCPLKHGLSRIEIRCHRGDPFAPSCGLCLRRREFTNLRFHATPLCLRMALLQKSDSIPNALPPDRLGDGQKRLHLPI